jgi:hypothetical protein
MKDRMVILACDGWRTVGTGQKTVTVYYGEPMSSEPEQTEDYASLYRRAFREYGARALWSMRALDDPTPADAPAITQALRTYGGMDGRRLAEEIERLCRAAH